MVPVVRGVILAGCAVQLAGWDKAIGIALCEGATVTMFGTVVGHFDRQVGMLITGAIVDAAQTTGASIVSDAVGRLSHHTGSLALRRLALVTMAPTLPPATRLQRRCEGPR